jgi:DNA polymerase I
MPTPILLLDVSSLAFRMYFALLRTDMRSSDGRPTWAVYGFCKALLDLQKLYPEYRLMAAVDSKGPTLRAQIHDHYKANRPDEMPEDLSCQWPIICSIFEKLGVPLLKAPGIEADDFVAAVAKKLHEPCFIVTGDRDLFQMVNDSIKVLYPNKKSGFDEIDHAAVVEKMGVLPSQIVDFKAIAGDASDNIPGVKGIGEKGACKLLAEYKTLDEIYSHLDEITGAIKQKLIDGKVAAYNSQWLATVQTGVDLGETWQPVLPNWSALVEFFSDLGMHSLVKRVSVESEQTADPFISELKVIHQKIESEVIAVEPLETGWCCSAAKANVYYSWEVGSLDNLVTTLILGWAIKDWSREQRAELEGKNWLDTQAMMHLYRTQYPAQLPVLWNMLREEAMPTIATATTILHEIFYTKLSQKEQDLLINIESPVSKVLGNVQDDGIALDVEALMHLKEDLYQKSLDVEQKICKQLPEQINIRSSRQLGLSLVSLGYKLKKTKTGQFSTDATELEKLLIADETDLIKDILDFRTYSKLHSTYTTTLLSRVVQGRLHTTFGHVATGRVSSNNPNLQNIPIRDPEYGSKFRACFVAEKGSVLLVADYSQIELRFLAHFCEDPVLLQAFNEGIDVHTQTASIIFEIPVDAVSKEQRRIGKTLNFALVYQQGVFGTAQQLGISMQEAKFFMDKYFQSFAKVKPYVDSVLETSKKCGYVETFYGRRRYFDNLVSSNMRLKMGEERAAFNAVLQGSNADLTKRAMVEIDKGISKFKLKSKLVLQVHDEILVEAPEKEAEQMKKIMIEAMEAGQPLRVPIVVDIGMGTNWDNAKS